MTKYTDEQAARAIVAVLPDSRWVGAALAQAYLWAVEGNKSLDDIARHLYDLNCYSLTKAKELVPTLATGGFLNHIKARTKTGSAENPITKMFPAAITEQRFLEEVDALRAKRKTVDYEDDRESGHTWQEMAAIQTFPKRFIIDAPRTEIQRQIGNAVPSLMGEILAREIAQQIFEKKIIGAPTLTVPKCNDIPKLEPVMPVPEKYMHLVGEHEAHPGTGKGRSYRTKTNG